MINESVTSGYGEDTISGGTCDVDAITLGQTYAPTWPYTITGINNSLNTGYVTNTGITSASFTNSTKSGLVVNGVAEFDGDVKIKGISLLEMLEKITQRLAILQPDPKKLEKYAALQRAYEHYITLEKLVSADDSQDAQ